MDELTWDEFNNELLWKQGEHCTLIGPTGQGKTTLALELLRRRGPVVVFAVKPRDPAFARLVRDEGYFLIEEWPPPSPRERFQKIVLWPPFDRMRDMGQQRERIRKAMLDIFEQGRWCVYFDECRYITQTLKLDALSEMYWLQGRSLGISFVVGTQRPRWIPLSAYDQATHLFMWRENDANNLRRYGEFSNDRDDLIDTLASLPACVSCPPDERCTCGKRGHFVYLNTRSGEQCVSRVELGEGG